MFEGNPNAAKSNTVMIPFIDHSLACFLFETRESVPKSSPTHETP